MGKRRTAETDDGAKCVVLVTTRLGEDLLVAGSVVSGTADEVAALVAAGIADASPAAVEYAESQQASE